MAVQPSDPKRAASIYCYWCFGADDNTLALTEGCICEANCGNEWCKHFNDIDSPANYIDGMKDDMGKHNKMLGFIPKGRTDKCIWCDTTEKAGQKDCICTVYCGNVNCPKKGKDSATSNGTQSWGHSGNGSSYGGSYAGTTNFSCSKDNAHGDCLFEWDGIKFAGDKKYDLEKYVGTVGQPKRLIINCSNSSFGSVTTMPSKIIDKAPAGLEALTDASYIWQPLDWAVSLDLAWSDGKAFPATLDWWIKLLELIKSEGYQEVYCCCVGGHGRTGTALAIIMMLTQEFNLKTTEEKAQMSIVAENWIKANYCSKAIETQAQQQYLDWIAEGILAKEKEAGHAIGEVGIAH